MKFQIHVPIHLHESLTEELSKLEHVTLPSGDKPGTITTEDGVLQFIPLNTAGMIEVTVISNPGNKTADEIKRTLEKHVNVLIDG